MPTPMVSIPEANLVEWGRFIKMLATNIDHRNPTNLGQDAAGQFVVTPLVTNTAPNALVWALIQKIRSHQRAVAAAPAGTVPARVLIAKAEFLAVLAEQKVALLVDPGNYEWVDFGQTFSPNVLAIRLPCDEVIREKEATILNGGTYNLADHLTNWTRDRDAGKPADALDRLILNDRRVGSYSLAHCEA